MGKTTTKTPPGFERKKEKCRAPSIDYVLKPSEPLFKGVITDKSNRTSFLKNKKLSKEITHTSFSLYSSF